MKTTQLIKLIKKLDSVPGNETNHREKILVHVLTNIANRLEAIENQTRQRFGMPK